MKKHLTTLILLVAGFNTHAGLWEELNGTAEANRTAEARRRAESERITLNQTQQSLVNTRNEIAAKQVEISNYENMIRDKKLALANSVAQNIEGVEQKITKNETLIKNFQNKYQTLREFSQEFSDFRDKTTEAIFYADALQKVGEILVKNELSLTAFIDAYFKLRGTLSEQELASLNFITNNVVISAFNIKSKTRKHVNQAVQDFIISLSIEDIKRVVILIQQIEANAKMQLDIVRSVGESLKEIKLSYEDILSQIKS